MSHIFHAPVAILTGAGCRRQLPECVSGLQPPKVLIVTEAIGGGLAWGSVVLRW